MGYSIREIEAPPAEPVTVAQAKAHCVITPASDTTHDAVLERYIKAARAHAEKYMGRRIIQQTIELVLDSWPWENFLELPGGQLRELVTVYYRDTDDAEQTWSSAEYRVDDAPVPARMFPLRGFTFPAHVALPSPIRVRYKVGYPPGTGSPTDYAANVPEDIKQAILLMVGTWFENREETIVGTISSQLPLGVEALLWPHRVLGF